MQGTQEAVEKAVRLHLAARDRNQRWLAGQLGVSEFWISRRMSGYVKFNVDDIDRIAKAFDTTTDRLIADADAIVGEKEVAA